jgi:hypothetical protein
MREKLYKTEMSGSGAQKKKPCAIGPLGILQGYIRTISGPSWNFNGRADKNMR